MKYFKCVQKKKKIKPKPSENHSEKIIQRLDRIENILHTIIQNQEKFEKTRIKRDTEADTEHRLRCEIMEIKRVKRESDYKTENESSNQDIKDALVDLVNKPVNKRGFFNFSTFKS